MDRTNDASGWTTRLELPLLTGVLVKRYKRFLADVRFTNGDVETVHCPNSGSMMGMDTPGSKVVVSDSGNPKRRLRRTLELVQVQDGASPSWVGVNTMRPNQWARSLVEAGLLRDHTRTGTVRSEATVQGGRLDLLVETPRGHRTWIEVKNTTLAAHAKDGALEAQFPDAVTERGRRHLRILMDRTAEGDRAVILFLVNRGDTGRYRPASWIDPDYADTLREARRAGVRIVAAQMEHHVRNTRAGTLVQTIYKGRLPIARDLTTKPLSAPGRGHQP